MRSFARGFVTLSIVVTVTLALFVGANLAVYGAYKIVSATQVVEPNPFLRKYGDAVRKTHPSKDMSEIRALLNETWSRGMVYDPVVQFKEAPRTGQYINVHPAGFRNSENQASWPPPKDRPVIFLFGGSATFGYNLEDRETLASYIARAWAAERGAVPAIYNFGRGRYGSSEEMLLFMRLIFEGHRPDIAIFVDGINDFYRRGARNLEETQVLSQLYDNWDSNDLNDHLPRLLHALPMSKAVNWLVTSLGLRSPVTGIDVAAPTSSPKAAPTSQALQDAATRTLALYDHNKRMIRAVAAEFGVRPVFVWQPIPFYRFDLSTHPFGDDVAHYDAPGLLQGFEEMERRWKSDRLGHNAIWCSDIQEGRTEQMYVDTVHYSAALNKLLASCIVEGALGSAKSGKS